MAASRITLGPHGANRASRWCAQLQLRRPSCAGEPGRAHIELAMLFPVAPARFIEGPLIARRMTLYDLVYTYLLLVDIYQSIKSGKNERDG